MNDFWTPFAAKGIMQIMLQRLGLAIKHLLYMDAHGYQKMIVFMSDTSIKTIDIVTQTANQRIHATLVLHYLATLNFHVTTAQRLPPQQSYLGLQITNAGFKHPQLSTLHGG